jgi:1,4-dihydroxy-2-naphthoyl-CoA hydrolase
MPIWYRDYHVEQFAQRGKGTASEHLGIEFTELGDDYLVGRMPVDARTRQPAGILHGGASALLAETLASSAANIVIDNTTHICVGLEINANHISSCKEGWVEGVARPIHLGKSTQVWEVRITQGDRLVCISRMTAAILERKAGK